MSRSSNLCVCARDLALRVILDLSLWYGERPPAQVRVAASRGVQAPRPCARARFLRGGDVMGALMHCEGI